MVRVINIDTKARTIRVSNGKNDLEWFTTDTGSHVPLKKGQSKAEAIKEHFGDGKRSGKSDWEKQQSVKKEVPPTQNESWGFFGTIGNEFYDEGKHKYNDAKTQEAWKIAFEEVQKATGFDDEKVREFLDSKDGRHFADQCADFGVAKNTRDGIEQAAKFWKERKWFPGTDKKAKQPAKQETEEKAHRIATNLFSAINTSQFTDAQLKSLISSFIYDEADNLDDDGVVAKDELNSEEFKRLKKFVAEKLAD